MSAIGHYRKCFRAVPSAAWWSFGVISTIATFAVPLAAKLVLADSAITNAALIAAMPVAALICVIIAPFREAYRMYQQKENELAKTKTDAAAALENERAVAAARQKQLETTCAALEIKAADAERKLNTDPNKTALRLSVQNYLDQCRRFLPQITAGSQDAVVGLRRLELDAHRYLQQVYPEYAVFNTIDCPVHTEGLSGRLNDSEFSSYGTHCKRRIEKFNEILRITG